MTYRFKVTLTGIKGFARVYAVSGKNTLHQFSRQMVSDMEFPMDQVVLFKAFDESGALVGKYATFDLGNGSIDRITVDALMNAKVVEMVYFYDTINKKSVNITFEGQAPMSVTSPVLIEEKGPNPDVFLSGYVAFEDLPAEKQKQLLNPEDEDYDDEDEMEEEEDEDEDQIYGQEYGDGVEED